LPDRWHGGTEWLNVIAGPVELTDLYPAHELLVARAGRNTLAEAAYCGIPTVALPITADPHRGAEQAANAAVAARLPAIFAPPESRDQSAIRQTLARALSAAQGGARLPGRRGNSVAAAFVRTLLDNTGSRPLTTVS
jgi:UDP:flavonoid glycosyltransferase YjiC (YdhE family)